MPRPTVKGNPHFNTAGYYVQIKVRVENDIAQPPAPAAPPPEGSSPVSSVYATAVRIWGESQATDRRCSDIRDQTQSKIEETYPTLPWLSTDDWNDHWFRYDEDNEYYRMCVEVSLSDGTKSFKCRVWKIPPGGEGEPAEAEIMDCPS